MIIVRENAGPIIRRRRRELDRTQDDLAKAIQCSATYLSEIERGVKMGSFAMIAAACEQLGLPAPMTTDAVVAELERLQSKRKQQQPAPGGEG